MFKQLKKPIGKSSWKDQKEVLKVSLCAKPMTKEHLKDLAMKCTFLSQTYHRDPLPSNKRFSLNKGVKGWV